MKTILLSFIPIFCLCLLAPSSSDAGSPVQESPQKVLLDDFDAQDLCADWSFSNGPEFPGATGSFKLTEEKSTRGKSGELIFDFSKGGNYVSAIVSIPPHLLGENASETSQS
ncbi:MAG: hypothetical protein ACP5I1_10830, partial [Candidatus Hinthialibacter sp.]